MGRGVGGEAPEKSRPKKRLQGKGFTDAPASFHLKPQLKKMFKRKKPSCSLDTKFFFVSLELTTFIFGNSLSKCSVVLLTKKFVKFC